MVEIEPENRLDNKFRQRTARIAVVGMGYVGLPMAVAFVRAGFDVTGLEVDSDRRDWLTRGISYIADLTDVELRSAIDTDRFHVSSNPSVLTDADAIIVCVPTPLRKSKDPDLTAILAAGEAIRGNLSEDQLIVLESTTYPGTTEEILLPMLES